MARAPIRLRNFMANLRFSDAVSGSDRKPAAGWLLHSRAAKLGPPRTEKPLDRTETADPKIENNRKGQCLGGTPPRRSREVPTIKFYSRRGISLKAAPKMTVRRNPYYDGQQSVNGLDVGIKRGQSVRIEFMGFANKDPHRPSNQPFYP